MDTKTETFYRQIFADLTLDTEENEILHEFLTSANPPPDKLVWLRAAVFRIGSEFLSDDGNTDDDVSLLRCMNAIVHGIEMCCMVPRNTDENDEEYEDSTENFETIYHQLYSDLVVDRDECQDLIDFLHEAAPPPLSKFIPLRALAFRLATEYLTEDREANVSLLRCINVIVHHLELAFMQPKPFTLKMELPDEDESALESLDLEKAVYYLWQHDVNRLTPQKDYTLNVQRGKKPYHKQEYAHDPLFTYVDTRDAFERPTYRTFIALLDNYIAETGVSENVTDEEREEIWNFLDAIMQTAPMQFCHKYCHAKDSDIVPENMHDFKRLLHKIWFGCYNRARGCRPDSCGFEHVFVGEIKDDQVSGFHNWIQFYLEERKGAVDYRGYIKPRNEADVTDDNDHVLTLQFLWNGVEKFMGTSLIGVSPEFEMALYTMFFLLGEEENEVKLDTGSDVFVLNVKCYTMCRDRVGTCFVEALAHYEEEDD